MHYGLMPEHDYGTMDKVLDLVCRTFPSGTINTLEIGVHKGNTSRGIHEYITAKGRTHFHTGIDNNHDLKVTAPFPGCRIITGNSIEVYNQVENESQHFIFLDGNHSYPYTLTDFLVYSDKVKNFGFIAFHDCSPGVMPFQDWQGIGAKTDADMFISCRKAVRKLGLLDGKMEGWKLVMDEYNINYPTGGIVVVQRINFKLGDKALYLGADEPMTIEINEIDLHEIASGHSSLYAPV